MKHGLRITILGESIVAIFSLAFVLYGWWAFSTAQLLQLEREGRRL